jgi:hypothetical protein
MRFYVETYRGIRIYQTYSDRKSARDGWYEADYGRNLTLEAKHISSIRDEIDRLKSAHGDRYLENPLRSGQYALIGLGVVTAGLLGYALWSKFGVQAAAAANQAAFSSSSSGNSPQELAAYQGYAAGVQASQQPGQ